MEQIKKNQKLTKTNLLFIVNFRSLDDVPFLESFESSDASAFIDLDLTIPIGRGLFKAFISKRDHEEFGKLDLALKLPLETLFSTADRELLSQLRRGTAKL